MPKRAWATHTPQLDVGQGQQLMAMADHGPPRTCMSRSETGQTKPGNSWLGGTTGQKQTEHVCFGCGKVGHIQANCPYKKAKLHATAAVRIQKEVDTGMTGNIAPADDTQEGETPPEDEDAKRE